LLKKYIPVVARIVFALFYFYVGVKWFALHELGDPAKDSAAPLGSVLLAPIVIIIFFFHLAVTGSWPWGALIWLTALAWYFRRGFDQLWNYAQPAQH
jgi:hypothetical protein